MTKPKKADASAIHDDLSLCLGGALGIVQCAGDAARADSNERIEDALFVAAEKLRTASELLTQLDEAGRQAK